MEVACRDTRLRVLRDELGKEKNMLFTRSNMLSETRAENSLISEVISDYEDYYKYIKKQKNEQLEALETISNYIDVIATTSNLTKDLLLATQQEQKELLGKMDKLRNEIDQLIDE